MTASSAKPNCISNSARCNYRFPNGMRCRLLGFAGQPFCPKHTEPPRPTLPDPAEVAATLTDGLDDFTDPVQINTFLSRLLLLLAQDKISARRAAVLTYISSQLLHSVPTIQKHEDKQPVEIIFDIPRPQRPDYVEPPKPESAASPDPEVHKEVRKDAQQSTPSEPQTASTVQPSAAVGARFSASPFALTSPVPKSENFPPAPSPQANPTPVSPTGVPTASPCATPQPGSRSTPVAMPNPALPGSFGLPQANPLGSPRAASTRQHMRQPSWADHDT